MARKENDGNSSRDENADRGKQGNVVSYGCCAIDFFYLVVVLFRYILRFLFFSRLVDYSLDFFFG